MVSLAASRSPREVDEMGLIAHRLPTSLPSTKKKSTRKSRSRRVLARTRAVSKTRTKRRKSTKQEFLRSLRRS